MFKGSKILLSLITTENGRKTLKNILLITLSPLIIIVLFIAVLGDATSKHNHEIIDVLFHNKEIWSDVPSEFSQSISTIKNTFEQIDTEIALLENVKGKIDDTFIKSILLSLSLNKENENVVDQLNIHEYTKLFYTLEIESNNDDESFEDNISTVIIPIKSSNHSIKNVQSFFGIDLTPYYDMIFEIYHVALTGKNKGLDTNVSPHYLLTEHFDNSEMTQFVGGTFGQMFDNDWKQHVTSEFGYREPIKLPDGTYTGNYHYGIDFGYEKGTPIYAPLDGKVVLSKYTEGDFGFYVVMDHGGGILTLYAHLSRIHVDEGEEVTQGETVGEVGSSGASTGNHLHFEIIEDRVRIDPRKYLK
ncbi:MAG: M23 family metallopeptidase [Erysipelotrichia bacterium]|nr:M23 family metallopeptidase [Erysipelotrichia bacterium]